MIYVTAIHGNLGPSHTLQKLVGVHLFVSWYSVSCPNKHFVTIMQNVPRYVYRYKQNQLFWQNLKKMFNAWLGKWPEKAYENALTVTHLGLVFSPPYNQGKEGEDNHSMGFSSLLAHAVQLFCIQTDRSTLTAFSSLLKHTKILVRNRIRVNIAWG